MTDKKPGARSGATYRGERRALAKKAKLVWGNLPKDKRSLRHAQVTVGLPSWAYPLPDLDDSPLAPLDAERKE